MKTYQYIAGRNVKTGEIVYSRAQHDYITDSEGNFMDGGQLSSYNRRSGLELIVIELPYSYGQSYDDWNYQINKLGKISPEEAKNIRIVPENEWIDRSSEEFKKFSLWGTYGIDGKGPKKTKCLEELDSDHLVAILNTQGHIGEYKKIIADILKDRNDIK